jgi:hypothetical protein
MSTKRRKIYIGLIGLGGVALAVDRFVLPGPVTGPELVAGSPNGTPPVVRPNPTSEPAAKQPIPELVFPRPLPGRHAGGESRDLFAPPPDMLAGFSSKSATDKNGPSGEDAAGGQALDRAVFSVQHQLGGILIHGGLKIAVVNGRWVRIKEAIGGCTLVGVGDNEATFECHDGVAVLRVAGAVGPAGD